jgi:hypothetical protein
MHQRPHLSHFIFFKIYEWAQYAREFNDTKVERLVKDKHPSLLGPLISFEEN